MRASISHLPPAEIEKPAEIDVRAIGVVRHPACGPEPEIPVQVVRCRPVFGGIAANRVFVVPAFHAGDVPQLPVTQIGADSPRVGRGAPL